MPLSDCLLDPSLSRNIDQDPWVWALFLGSSPNRGLSPVEWVDFLSVRLFVRPPRHPARVEAQPARPEAQPAQPKKIIEK